MEKVYFEIVAQTTVHKYIQYFTTCSIIYLGLVLVHFQKYYQFSSQTLLKVTPLLIAQKITFPPGISIQDHGCPGKFALQKTFFVLHALC